MARNDPQVAVRLPSDVKAFIKAEAKENASSQNSEIVRAIRAAMKVKGAVPDAVKGNTFEPRLPCPS